MKNDKVSYDLILSGPIPPNPTELICTSAMSVFINDLKNKYDHIILDSAPSLLVSDTLNLSAYADTTVFVSRSNYTRFDVIDFINTLKEDNSLPNICSVLNYVDQKTGKYGYNYLYSYGYKYNYNYGYGYGYEEEKES